MKILIVGDWHSELHEEAVYQAFLQLGHEVSRFAWHLYFKPVGFFYRLIQFVIKAQNKYMLGHIVDKLNKDFLEKSFLEKPDLIFVYRGTHIYAKTLQHLKELLPHTILVGHNNDDPFSPLYPKWKWRHFIGCIPKYDLVLAYRLHNIDEFKLAGARRVKLLRSWFMPERNYPIQLTQQEYDKFGCDIVFIGHYENDGRLDYFDALADAGIYFRIYGPEWHKAPARTWLKNMGKIFPVRGEDYTRVLCSSKIALCVLSRLNRDTYTRRVFEIPATQTMMFSEYTDDLATLFIENKEAVFFRSPSELVEKAKKYLADDQLRKNIAQAGYKKVTESGHDVISRMKQVLIWSEQIQGD